MYVEAMQSGHVMPWGVIFREVSEKMPKLYGEFKYCTILCHHRRGLRAPTISKLMNCLRDRKPQKLEFTGSEKI